MFCICMTILVLWTSTFKAGPHWVKYLKTKPMFFFSFLLICLYSVIRLLFSWLLLISLCYIEWKYYRFKKSRGDNFFCWNIYGEDLSDINLIEFVIILIYENLIWYALIIQLTYKWKLTKKKIFEKLEK